MNTLITRKFWAAGTIFARTCKAGPLSSTMRRTFMQSTGTAAGFLRRRWSRAERTSRSARPRRTKRTRCTAGSRLTKWTERPIRTWRTEETGRSARPRRAGWTRRSAGSRRTGLTGRSSGRRRRRWRRAGRTRPTGRAGRLIRASSEEHIIKKHSSLHNSYFIILY